MQSARPLAALMARQCASSLRQQGTGAMAGGHPIAAAALLLQRLDSAQHCSTSSSSFSLWPTAAWQLQAARGYARASRGGGSSGGGGVSRERGGGRSDAADDGSSSSSSSRPERYPGLRRRDALATPGAGDAAPLGRVRATLAPLAALPVAASLLPPRPPPPPSPRDRDRRGPPPPHASPPVILDADGFSADPSVRAPPPPAPDRAGDSLEATLELRELVEGSAFPSEFKRLAFRQPWGEFMVAARRTFKRTSTGRVARFHVALAVGNYDGLVGLGIADASSMQKATADAYFRAYANVTPVPRYRGHTLYHALDATFHKLRLQMWPRRSGFGLSGSNVLRELCRMAGIRDVTAKLSGRRRNRFHVAQAWLQAVAGQSAPHDGVEGGGVYVRERFTGAKLPYGLQRGVHVP